MRSFPRIVHYARHVELVYPHSEGYGKRGARILETDLHTDTGAGTTHKHCEKGTLHGVKALTCALISLQKAQILLVVRD